MATSAARALLENDPFDGLRNVNSLSPLEISCIIKFSVSTGHNHT